MIYKIIYIVVNLVLNLNCKLRINYSKFSHYVNNAKFLGKN